jgi:type I restriction-modification system DNA methylase subunit
LAHPSNDSYRQYMSLVKSKQRVADHGEVFTPTWMVEAMLDLVKDETERIDS